MAFYVYILRCSDSSYYTGHTENLEARIAQHQAGVIPGYTSKRLPVELCWSEEFPARIDALERERQLKGWSRAKKEALFHNDWEKIKQLSRSSSPSTGSGRTEVPS